MVERMKDMTDFVHLSQVNTTHMRFIVKLKCTTSVSNEKTNTTNVSDQLTFLRATRNSAYGELHKFVPRGTEEEKAIYDNKISKALEAHEQLGPMAIESISYSQEDGNVFKLGSYMKQCPYPIIYKHNKVFIMTDNWKAIPNTTSAGTLTLTSNKTGSVKTLQKFEVYSVKVDDNTANVEISPGMVVQVKQDDETFAFVHVADDDIGRESCAIIAEGPAKECWIECGIIPTDESHVQLHEPRLIVWHPSNSEAQPNNPSVLSFKHHPPHSSYKCPHFVDAIKVLNSDITGWQGVIINGTTKYLTDLKRSKRSIYNCDVADFEQALQNERNKDIALAMIQKVSGVGSSADHLKSVLPLKHRWSR